MKVLKSRKAFNEVLRDLRGSGSICVPSEIVPDFVSYCAGFGVYPLGGCLINDYDNTVCQWLYL